MDVNQTFFCSVLQDKKSQSKYICYTKRADGGFLFCLTDAADVWSSELTAERLEQFGQKFASQSAEDSIQRIWSSCLHGDVSIVVNSSSADVNIGSGSTNLSVTLNKLEPPQAQEKLKELLFNMADSLTQSESKSVTQSISPVKSPQKRLTEFEPRQQNGASSVMLKKRLPGASLINPGTKKKQKATGVAFDDADED